jgi:tetratricopeptide (TPR) repeat protein
VKKENGNPAAICGSVASKAEQLVSSVPGVSNVSESWDNSRSGVYRGGSLWMSRGRQMWTIRLSFIILVSWAGECPALQCSHDAPMVGRNYAASIALRSSQGFRAALDDADTQLKGSPGDCDAAGVRALVYANGVDFLAMSGRETRPAKYEALALALKVAPTNPWTRAAFGLIHMFDEPAAAEHELQVCIRESPGFLECYNLLGDLLRKQRRFVAGDRVYLAGLSRWPKDGELLVSYALSLEAQGHFTKGIEILNRVVVEQPTYPRGHWHLAVMMYETGGDRARIRKEAERALSIDPLIWHGREFISILDGTVGIDRINLGHVPPSAH